MRGRRINYANIVYHVTNRGASGKPIFSLSLHKEYFLNLLRRAQGKFNIRIYAYCIMTNHYHLMIETSESNLSSCFCWINTMYSKYYNKFYSRTGPNYNSRYFSKPVDDNIYLLVCSRYIHNNPVSAGMVKTASEYDWSSYNLYMQQHVSRHDWIDTQKVQSVISMNRERACVLYSDFVNGKETPIRLLNNAPEYDADCSVFGSATFCKYIDIKYNNGENLKMDKQIVDKLHDPYVEIVMSVVTLMYDVTLENLLMGAKEKLSLQRSVAMYCMFDICEDSFESISELFKDYNANEVQESIKSLVDRLDIDRHLHDHVRLLHRVIKDKVILQDFMTRQNRKSEDDADTSADKDIDLDSPDDKDKH